MVCSVLQADLCATLLNDYKAYRSSVNHRSCTVLCEASAAYAARQVKYATKVARPGSQPTQSPSDRLQPLFPARPAIQDIQIPRHLDVLTA